MRSPYKFACVHCAARCTPNCSASKLRDGKQAIAARSGEQKYDEDYSYDANGNILTLNRKDDKAAVMDDFNYSYYANTNRLFKHKTAGGAYEYDAIGNLVKDNSEGLSITWTPSGKVRSVTKPDTTIYFRYDATGNRIAKIVSTPTKSDTTAYVRDASGNVMTVYNNRTATEAPIYGSSRIGEYTGKEKEGYQTFNLRKYELTNHLGNVLAVISDKVNLYGHNNILDSARATVMSASDYYPFGLPMKERSFNSTDYRFGFNGGEKDDEVKGFGNWYIFGDYGYDPRIIQRPARDPESSRMLGESPYSVMHANPILNFDPNGRFSISNHYKFTKSTMVKLGYAGYIADRVAHYSSTYADHPAQWISEQQGQPYRAFIDYGPTRQSQNTASIANSTWHSMRADGENISSDVAMARGQSFGWGKLMEAAGEIKNAGGINKLDLNSKGMQALGQGVHALQDAVAHKGTDMDSHSVPNDMYPSNADKQLTEQRTFSALVTVEVLSGNYKNLKSGMTIDLSGTTAEQYGAIKSAYQNATSGMKDKNFKVYFTGKPKE